MIAVIAYLAHQMSVSGLPDTPVLRDLAQEKRGKSSLDTALSLTNMFTDLPTYKWAEVLDTADIPHNYFLSFAALASTSFFIMYSSWIA